MSKNAITRWTVLRTAMLTVGFTGVPLWTTPSASAAAHPAACLAADSDKKEEEPKGDPVDVDKLPKVVVEAVKKTMPGARITKAAKLDDGNYFLDDVKVGKKLWDLTVTPKGEIVKKVEMKENG